MKTAILVTLMTLGLSANASYYQVDCSSGDAKTRLAHGHSENFVSVTERVWGEDGQVTETVIRDDERAFNTELTDTKEISRSNEQHCAPGQDSGWASWQEVSVSKLTITKNDGSLFSENTIGVSQDRKSVTAFMICEENGNSETMCEK